MRSRPSITTWLMFFPSSGEAGAAGGAAGGASADKPADAGAVAGVGLLAGAWAIAATTGIKAQNTQAGKTHFPARRARPELIRRKESIMLGSHG